MGNRARKKYTPDQIKGMMTVARICKATRESFGLKRFEPGTLRQWVKRLEAERGEGFSIHDIGRYEAAGKSTDPRTTTINAISDRYLRAIAPDTGYSYVFLRDLHDGITTPALMGGRTLAALLRDRQEELGDSQFKKLQAKWNLTQDKIDAATIDGFFYEGSDGALSSLLRIPVDAVLDATIAGLLASAEAKEQEADALDQEVSNREKNPS